MAIGPMQSVRLQVQVQGLVTLVDMAELNVDVAKASDCLLLTEA